MAIHKIKTYMTIGLTGYELTIEVDSNKSLPGIEIIGLPDNAIKESKERIRGTLRNCGIQLPNKKIILNLAPSHLRKIGTAFDLPMAVGLLALVQEGESPHRDLLSQSLFFGELGLDGQVKRVNGLLPAVISAFHHGVKHFFIPAENRFECEYLSGATFYPIDHFQQLVDFFITGNQSFPTLSDAKNLQELYQNADTFSVDFAQIKGHEFAKRALTIAAAGMHNICLVGAPGSGKTLLARALQSILPPLGFSEILEVSQIYSLVGKLNKDQPLITVRPFRQVHHTASKVSIVGGGQMLMPGELSLANKGVLFFDELPEFPREVLEVLRQPLEDKLVTISRASGSVMYPAQVMFVAAMNPCKCGFYKDPQKPCQCSYLDIKKYQSRISGPLLDRIDMILEIPRENIDTLLEHGTTSSSAQLREKVIQTWNTQQMRFQESDIKVNAQISSQNIDTYIPLSSSVKEFVKQASTSLNLSPRVVHRTLKLARTIADLEGSEDIQTHHVAESLQYRNKNMFIES